jgi:multidrug resistance efflux pump
VLVKIAVALVVVAGASVGGFLWLGSGTSATTAAGESAIQRVSAKSFDVVLTANGDLQAGEETVLRNPLEKPSAIVEIVSEGAMVRKGDLLVRLSTDDIQRDLDNQLLDLETARSEMIRAENNLAIQESDNSSSMHSATIKLELARLELKKWEEGDDAERRQQIAIDIDAAEREVTRLREKFERAKKLHDQSFLSTDELKRDELELIRQEANLVKANLRKEVYETYERVMQLTRLTSAIQESEAELSRVARRNQSELASKNADVTNRQRQLKLREDRVRKLQEQIAAATITAPTAGLVVYATSIRQDRWGGNEGPLKVGTTVSPNDEIIILPDNSRMVAAIKVHESLVGKVRPGQHARVKIDAIRDRLFTGTVESVGVVAEQGGWRDPNLREYAVRIALDLGEENPGLKPSMRCEGQIVLNTVEDTLAAPIQSVFYDGNRAYVHVPASGGKFAKREVRVGTRSDSYAQILAGLSPGDAVLLRRPQTGELASDTIDALSGGAEGIATKADATAKPGERRGQPVPAEAPVQAATEASEAAL